MEISQKELQSYFAFRPPYVYVDSIEEVAPLNYAIGVRYFPKEEWFFACHFSDDPMVPGNLIAESMGQVLGLAVQSNEEHRGKKFYLVATDKLRLLNRVRPGDTLRTKAVITSYRRGLLSGHCESYVNDVKIAVADITLLEDGVTSLKPKVE